jgi:hypothetical protein
MTVFCEKLFLRNPKYESPIMNLANPCDEGSEANGCFLSNDDEIFEAPIQGKIKPNRI